MKYANLYSYVSKMYHVSDVKIDVVPSSIVPHPHVPLYRYNKYPCLFALHTRETLLNFSHSRTTMIYDLVEIRIIPIHENKWLLYTLHLSMKHTKY